MRFPLLSRHHIAAIEIPTYYEVHVFHGHRTEQDFVAQHERAGEAAAIAEMHFDGADVSAETVFARRLEKPPAR